MMPGGPATQSTAYERHMIQDMIISIISGGAVRVKANIHPRYRGRYFAPYINGVYIGRNYLAPLNEALSFTVQANVTNDVRVALVDAGKWSSFANGKDPRWRVELEEKQTASKLRFTWDAAYNVQTPYGDSQLSSIAVVGAKRGYNCQKLQEYTTRARLFYTVTTSGLNHTIKWWNKSMLVAEGTRSGDGAFTCTEVDDSGLTITGTLTYTAEVTLGTAMLDIHWPKQYQIHYTTGALTPGRTPEATAQDELVDSFIYLSPAMAAGTYNWQILGVSDDGVVQSSGIPVTSALTIIDNPAAPIITGVTGTASALTVNWTVGEAGCTFKIYHSKVNSPVNLGEFNSPVPITTALDATSQVLPAITGYAPVDRTTNINTLKSAFDIVVANLNVGYAAGMSGFDIVLTTALVDIKLAIETYLTALNMNLLAYSYENINNTFAALIALNTNADATWTDVEWREQIGYVYGMLLANLGGILCGDSGRYALPTGIVIQKLNNSVVDNLVAIANPVVLPGKIWIIVRAVKDGIEEQSNKLYEVEFDNTGAIVPRKPKDVSFRRLSVSGNVITAELEYHAVNENANIAAISKLNLYVVAAGAAITLSSPSVQGTPERFSAQHFRATVIYTIVTGAGWYDIAAAAVTTGGGYSLNYPRRRMYVGASGQATAQNVAGTVITGKKVV